MRTKWDIYCSFRKLKYSNIIITNGFLLNDDLLIKLSQQNIKYIQITLDGDKSTHNQRRTTANKIDTYSIIKKNIDSALKHDIEIVVRINVDKSNYESIIQLIEDIALTFDRKYFGKQLFLAFGRVFGSSQSYTLSEYEKYLQPLYLKAAKYNLIIPNISPSDSGAFCSAETQNHSMTVDVFGYVYKCWNDVFHFDESICKLEDYRPFELQSDFSQKNHLYIEELSLDSINNGDCLKCKYFKYCNGLCPSMRNSILNGTEENLYKNQYCYDVVHNRLETLLTAYLIQAGVIK